MPTLTPRRRGKTRLRFGNLAELLHWLGDIPADRVVFDPLPGTATRRDLLRLHETSGKRHELVCGVLVENTMGAPESYVAMELGFSIRNYLTDHDLGFVCGADMLVSLSRTKVRGPDVCFTPWTKRPERTVPLNPISDLIPDLVVEVLSVSNTAGEIARKLIEYFEAGVKLVWVIDPRTRTAEVYLSATDPTALPESGTLDGGGVLPGFRLPLTKLFARLARPEPAKKPRKKK